MMGMAFRADDLAESLGAWEILGRALTAVHGAAVPVETEPATQVCLLAFKRPHEPEG
jgi:hypothetical protein